MTPEEKALIDALRELLRPEQDQRTAFRLEDWNEWPERWIKAFQVVRLAAEAGQAE